MTSHISCAANLHEVGGSGLTACSGEARRGQHGQGSRGAEGPES